MKIPSKLELSDGVPRRFDTFALWYLFATTGWQRGRLVVDQMGFIKLCLSFFFWEFIRVLVFFFLCVRLARVFETPMICGASIHDTTLVWMIFESLKNGGRGSGRDAT